MKKNMNTMTRLKPPTSPLKSRGIVWMYPDELPGPADPDELPFPVTRLTRAAAATAVHALDDLALLQLRLRHAADAVRRKVCVSRLNTSETTKVLVSLLLPLCDQSWVCNLLFNTIVVEFS